MEKKVNSHFLIYKFLIFFTVLFFGYFISFRADAAVVYTQGSVTDGLIGLSGAMSVTFGNLSGVGNVGVIQVSIGHTLSGHSGYTSSTIVGNQIQFALYTSNYSSSPCTNGNPADSTHWMTITSDAQTTYNFDVSAYNCPISQTYAIDVIPRNYTNMNNIATAASGTDSSPGTRYIALSDSAGFPATVAAITSFTWSSFATAGLQVGYSLPPLYTSTDTPAVLQVTLSGLDPTNTGLWTKSFTLDPSYPSNGSVLLPTPSLINLSGYYTVNATLSGCLWSTCSSGTSNWSVASTTSYLYGTTTSPYLNATGGSIDTTMATSTSCSSIFTFGSCLQYLFVPNFNTIQSAYGNAVGSILTVMPIGYLTRLSTLIASTSSTTLPSISYTFPSNYPTGLFAGTTWGFSLQSMVASSSLFISSVSSYNGYTYSSIFTTLLAYLVWAMVIFSMIAQVSGKSWFQNEDTVHSGVTIYSDLEKASELKGRYDYKKEVNRILKK